MTYLSRLIAVKRMHCSANLNLTTMTWKQRRKRIRSTFLSTKKQIRIRKDHRGLKELPYYLRQRPRHKRNNCRFYLSMVFATLQNEFHFCRQSRPKPNTTSRRHSYGQKYAQHGNPDMSRFWRQGSGRFSWVRNIRQLLWSCFSSNYVPSLSDGKRLPFPDKTKPDHLWLHPDQSRKIENASPRSVGMSGSRETNIHKGSKVQLL